MEPIHHYLLIPYVIPAIYTLPLQFHFTHAKRQEPKGE